MNTRGFRSSLINPNVVVVVFVLKSTLKLKFSSLLLNINKKEIIHSFILLLRRRSKKVF